VVIDGWSSEQSAGHWQATKRRLVLLPLNSACLTNQRLSPDGQVTGNYSNFGRAELRDAPPPRAQVFLQAFDAHQARRTALVPDGLEILVA
jgi:hypothetical protein